MNEVLKHIELIESYVEGRLTEKERQDFETRLVIDSNLKEEFDLYKNIVEGIKEIGEENLKAKLKLADNELDTETKIVKLKPKINIKYWSIAASFVFLIGIGLFFYMSNSSNLNAIATKYYEKDKGLPVEMAVGKSKWEDVMNLYKSDDYTGTKIKLQKLAKENPANDTLNYFYGVVNFELKDYRQARANLNNIKSESKYYEKAQYRLILIDLKINDKQQAIAKINECLVNNQHLYYDKLLELKAELTK